MLLSFTQGHENFRQETCKVSVFYRQLGQREVPILRAIRPHQADGFRSIAQRQAYQVASGEDEDTQETVSLIKGSQSMAGVGNRNFGYWHDATVNIPEHTFIRIMFQKKAGSLILYDRMQVLLRMRKNAALRRVLLELSNNPVSTRHELHFEGRYDIIGLHLFGIFDIKIPKNIHPQFDPEVWEDNIKIGVLEKEVSRLVLSKKRTIVKASGEKVQIRKSNKRLIRMSKPQNRRRV